jgi:hypothetical protein
MMKGQARVPAQGNHIGLPLRHSAFIIRYSLFQLKMLIRLSRPNLQSCHPVHVSLIVLRNSLSNRRIIKTKTAQPVKKIAESSRKELKVPKVESA